MNTKRPTTNSSEIIERISNYVKDADWSVEELREELSRLGEDPDLLLKNIKAKILPLLQQTNTFINQNPLEIQADSSAPNLLSLIRKFTSKT
jgi:hypothetical protein